MIIHHPSAPGIASADHQTLVRQAERFGAVHVEVRSRRPQRQPRSPKRAGVRFRIRNIGWATPNLP